MNTSRKLPDSRGSGALALAALLITKDLRPALLMENLRVLLPWLSILASNLYEPAGMSNILVSPFKILPNGCPFKNTTIAADLLLCSSGRINFRVAINFGLVMVLVIWKSHYS